MSSTVRVANHPVHPMFVVFPLGLWFFSLVAQIVFLLGGGPGWHTSALYTMGGGVIGALLAAVPGFIDLLSLPPGPAKTLGKWHMVLNVAALVLFIATFFVLFDNRHATALVLSLIGAATISVSGWLGGAMVYEHGVAVTSPLAERKKSHHRHAA